MPKLFEYSVNSPVFGSVLLSFAAAFLSAFLAAQTPSVRRTIARVLSVALLAALSFYVGGPILLTASLLLFAAGDALINLEEEAALRFGRSFLLTGYVGFAVLFFRAARLELFIDALWRPVLAIVILAAAGFAATRLRWSPFDPPRFLALACAVATAVFAAATAAPWLMVGTALLLAFTLLSAVETQMNAAWRAISLWCLFYSAQLLITLAGLVLI